MTGLDKMKVRFECAFSVENVLIEDAADPKLLIDHLKQDACIKIAKEINKRKPDFWKTRSNLMTESQEFGAVIYIFTPAELKKWQNIIIEKVNLGEIT